MAKNTDGLSIGSVGSTTLDATGVPIALAESIRGGGIGNYTTTERNAIDGRVLDNNMIIYNTTTNQYEHYTGGSRNESGVMSGGSWTAFTIGSHATGLPNAPANDASEAKRYELNVPTSGDATWTEVSADSSLSAGNGIDISATEVISVDLDGNTLTNGTNGLSVTNPFTDADETKLDGITTYTGQTAAGDYTVPVRDSGNTTTKFLREDGDWVVPTDTNTTYTAGNGLLLASNDEFSAAAGTGITVDSSGISVTNPFTEADETKLDGIAVGATNYTSSTYAGQTAAGNYTVPVRDAGNTTTKFLREDGDWVALSGDGGHFSAGDGITISSDNEIAADFTNTDEAKAVASKEYVEAELVVSHAYYNAKGSGTYAVQTSGTFNDQQSTTIFYSESGSLHRINFGFGSTNPLVSIFPDGTYIKITKGSSVGYYRIDSAVYMLNNQADYNIDPDIISGTEVFPLTTADTVTIEIATLGLGTQHTFSTNVNGLVPGPAPADVTANHLLQANGDWVNPEEVDTTYAAGRGLGLNESTDPPEFEVDIVENNGLKFGGAGDQDLTVDFDVVASRNYVDSDFVADYTYTPFFTGTTYTGEGVVQSGRVYVEDSVSHNGRALSFQTGSVNTTDATHFKITVGSNVGYYHKTLTSGADPAFCYVRFIDTTDTTDVDVLAGDAQTDGTAITIEETTAATHFNQVIFTTDLAGVVPGPTSTESTANYYLAGNATWVEVSDNDSHVDYVDNNGNNFQLEEFIHDADDDSVELLGSHEESEDTDESLVNGALQGTSDGSITLQSNTQLALTPWPIDEGFRFITSAYTLEFPGGTSATSEVYTNVPGFTTYTFASSKFTVVSGSLNTTMYTGPSGFDIHILNRGAKLATIDKVTSRIEVEGTTDSDYTDPVATGDRSVATGDSSSATGTRSIAVGQHTTASNRDSVAIGPYAASADINEIRLGHGGAIVTVADTVAGVETLENQVVSKRYVDDRISSTSQSINASDPNEIITYVEGSLDTEIQNDSSFINVNTPTSARSAGTVTHYLVPYTAADIPDAGLSEGSETVWEEESVNINGNTATVLKFVGKNGTILRSTNRTGLGLTTVIDQFVDTLDVHFSVVVHAGANGGLTSSNFGSNAIASSAVHRTILEDSTETLEYEPAVIVEPSGDITLNNGDYVWVTFREQLIQNKSAGDATYRLKAYATNSTDGYSDNFKFNTRVLGEHAFLRVSEVPGAVGDLIYRPSTLGTELQIIDASAPQIGIRGAAILDDAITNAKLADDAVDLDQIDAGTSSAGYVLKVNSANDGLEWASDIDASYLEVNSTSAQPTANGTEAIALGANANALAENTISIGSSSTTATYAGQAHDRIDFTGATIDGNNLTITGITIDGAAASPTNSVYLPRYLSIIYVGTDNVSRSATLDGNAFINSSATETLVLVDPITISGAGRITYDQGNNAVAVGHFARAAGNDALALGVSSQSIGRESIAIGNSSYATDTAGISMGYSSASYAALGIALGSGAQVASGHSSSIALGYNSATTATNQLMIGSTTPAESINAIRTPGFTGGTNQFISVDTNGNWSTTSVEAESYIDVNSDGTHANATGQDAIAIGENARASGDHAIAIGYNAVSTVNRRLVIGSTTQTESITSIQTPGIIGDADKYVKIDASGNWSIENAPIVDITDTVASSAVLAADLTLDSNRHLSVNVSPVMSSAYVVDQDTKIATKKYVDDSVAVDSELSDYDQTIAYNTDDDVISITYTQGSTNYFKSFTYNTDGDITAVALYTGTAVDADNRVYNKAYTYTDGNITSIDVTLD